MGFWNDQCAFSSNKDDWETPQELFDELNARYNFTLDPCSNGFNAKCKKFYTASDNGLIKSWKGEVVFCNPPYGRSLKHWVKKCYEESKECFVCLLIPARTDTTYFHDYIYRKDGVEIDFIKGRLKFEVNGIKKDPAPFPSMLVYFDRRCER